MSRIAPMPRFAQQNAPTIQGRSDINWQNNCGETACAIVAKLITGVTLYPSIIHDLELGPDFLGPEDNLQICDFLNGACEIGTRLFLPTDQETFSSIVHRFLATDQPLIHLRRNGDGTVGHWCVIYGAEQGAVVSLNTWDASDITESIGDCWTNSMKVSPAQRMVIGILRQRAIQINPQLQGV